MSQTTPARFFSTSDSHDGLIVPVGLGTAFSTPFKRQYSQPSIEQVHRFRDWLVKGPESQYWDEQDWQDWIQMIRLLPSLRGKSLSDSVPLDWPSHADVLLELANGPYLPMFSVSWTPVS